MLKMHKSCALLIVTTGGWLAIWRRGWYEGVAVAMVE